MRFYRPTGGLLLLALLSAVQSFSFPKFQIPKYSFDLKEITETGKKNAIIGGSLLAICFISTTTMAPAFADLASDDSAEIESVAPRMMKISTNDESSPTLKKTTTLKNDVTTEDDRSYSSSLKKEQAIQNARKKTKAERAKDMCEMMGRGC